MIAERNRITLAQDTYAYVGRASDSENAEVFKSQIKDYIKILNKIVETDFNKLSGKDLYELLCTIYSISPSTDDFLKMISKQNNNEFTRIHRIPTTMTYFERKTENHGGRFDYWNQPYQVYFLIAASDKFEIDFNKIYSKDEIKKMLTDKIIVILKKEEKEIENINDSKYEDYEIMPILNIEVENNGSDIYNFILNDYDLFEKLLKDKFTKCTVLKDAQELINDLEEDIRGIYVDAEANTPLYSDTAKVCRNWFESSSYKIEFQKIKKQINKRASKN